MRSKPCLLQFRSTIGTCSLVMFSSTIYAIIVDSLFPWAWRGTKEAPCIKSHFSHLSLPNEIVNTKEDCYYRDNIKWKWKQECKDKADTYWDCNPHKLTWKESLRIRVQQLLLVYVPKMFLEVWQQRRLSFIINNMLNPFDEKVW